MSTAIDNKCNQISTLSPLERIVARARLEIYPERCLKLRHRKSGCQACQDFCPAEAISFSDSLEIDCSRCYGCGICANLCPTEVFQLGTYAYRSLLAQAEGKNEVKFACSQRSAEADEVKIPCLGYLNESLLIGAIGRGAQTVSLNGAHCEGCNLRLGFQAAWRSLRRADRILAIFSQSERVRITTSGQGNVQGIEDSRHYSRRELFAYLGQSTRNIVKQAGESAAIAANGLNQIKTRLDPRLPEKRHILLQSLKALGEPAIAKVESEDLPFLQIEMSGECDGCGLCVTFCPSLALRQYDRNGKRVIEFSSAFCLACNLCLEICPRGALTSSTYLNTDDLVTGKSRVLVEQEHSTCARCGQISIAPMVRGLCPNCQKTKEIKEWLIRQR